MSATVGSTLHTFSHLITQQPLEMVIITNFILQGKKLRPRGVDDTWDYSEGALGASGRENQAQVCEAFSMEPSMQRYSIKEPPLLLLAVLPLGASPR